MQHVVNKAVTQAGNHRYGSAGHNQGRVRALRAADVQVSGKPIPVEGGC